MFLIQVTRHNKGWVLAGSEPPNGGHHVWLGEDDHAVSEGEHVGHPALVLLIAVLGGHLVVGCHNGGSAVILYIHLNFLQFALHNRIVLSVIYVEYNEHYP